MMTEIGNSSDEILYTTRKKRFFEDYVDSKIGILMIQTVWDVENKSTE